MTMYPIRVDDRPVSYTMESGSPTERVEPITLEQTRAHLRLTSTSEDAMLNVWRSAARTHFEEQTGRQCVDAVWEYALDGSPYQGVLELPRPPLASVVSVVYDDGDGVEQTLDAATYRVLPSFITPVGSPGDAVIDPYCAPGRIELASGTSWPTTNGLARNLRIRRTCGYGATAVSMPSLLQATLLLLVGHFYNNRDEVVEVAMHRLPMGIETLLQGFKWTALSTVPRTTTTAPLFSRWVS